MSKELDELWRLWEKKYGLMVKRRNPEGWMVCPEDGAQVHLWQDDGQSDRRNFNVIPAGSKSIEARCWMTRDELGLMVEGKYTSDPIPAYAPGILRRAYPGAPEDSFFGYWEGERLIAIYDTYEGFDYSRLLHTFVFLLPGERDPGLHIVLQGRSFPHPRKWWDAVDSGKLRLINSLMIEAANPVEGGSRSNGTCDVFRIHEPWTGIDGPATYVYSRKGPSKEVDLSSLKMKDVRAEIEELDSMG